MVFRSYMEIFPQITKLIRSTLCEKLLDKSGWPGIIILMHPYFIKVSHLRSHVFQVGTNYQL